MLASVARMPRDVTVPPPPTQGAGAPVCPFCGAKGRHAFFATDRNRAISAKRFRYCRCIACGTLFLSLIPSDLGRYYSGDYSGYQFDADGEPSWKRNDTRLRSAAFRVELVRQQVAPGHLIEIGAGAGAFAIAAKAAGFEVSAIEMDEGCCRYLREQGGVHAICSDRPLEALDSLPSARAIVLWHALEHLPNPAEVLERAARALEPGGVLAIGIPNPSSLQFRLMRGRWPHIDAPRHLCLIPPAALVARGARIGLRTVAMTTTDPEGLDFDLLGWIDCLRRNPADGPPGRGVALAGLALRRLLAPLERRGNRGAAVTVVMRREGRVSPRPVAG
jgi:SAM-dependent methyltransferase